MQSSDSGFDRESLLRTLEMSSSDSSSDVPPPPPVKKNSLSGHRDIVRAKVERKEQRYTDAIIKAKRDQKARLKQREKRNKRRRADAKLMARTIEAAMQMWCVLNKTNRPLDAPTDAPVHVAFIRDNWDDLNRLKAECQAKQTAPLSRAEKFFQKRQRL